jgi:lysophospholipase L1-like esterase
MGGSAGAASSAGAAGTGGASGAYSPCSANGSPCKIMPLGDSITWGYGATDGGGYRVELFHKALAASQNITFVGSDHTGPPSVDGVAFPPANEGHPSWTIDGSSMGLYPKVQAWLQTSKPDIVTLMIGTNDMSQSIDLANAPERLGRLMDRITETLPNALLVVAQITPGKSGELNTKIEAFNAAIPALVTTRQMAGKHVAVVNMYQAFTKNPDFSKAYLHDSVHPNDAGYPIMGDVWYQSLAGVLPAK